MLELRAASRLFGSLRAVDGLDLRLEPGELRAIVGENGAGKSTALKMLAGHLAPSSGVASIDGVPLRPATPQAAIARGVGMVHQHFMLIENFTVLENLVLGAEPTDRWGRLAEADARARALALVEQTGFTIPLDHLVGELAVGERQRLEILRVLFRGARALLLDEPTAVLTPPEIGELYAALRRLCAEGATVAVVSHRLDEVARYCDAVTVMRRGRKVHERALPRGGGGDGAGSDLLGELTAAIMGAALVPEVSRPAAAESAEPVLRLSGVCAARPDGTAALTGIDLAVRGGEIVGIAGVEGNGQRELARLLAGLDAPSAGSVQLDGRVRGGAQPTGGAHAVREARRHGLVVVHEDRQRDELLLDATVSDNLVLGDLGQVSERAAVTRRLGRFEVRPADPRRLAGELSGGNQQKLVMARALDRSLRVLVLAQPTRGVDVGTARAIQGAIAQAARDGAAVLLLSADLNELRQLSHRLLVLRRGRLVAELAPEATDEEIGRAMLGSERA